jgi:hypothetical protein
MKEPKDVALFLLDQYPAVHVGITTDVHVPAYRLDAPTDVRGLQHYCAVYIRERAADVGPGVQCESPVHRGNGV